MANKTFRRVLSIIMCAAMLVSVFSASFQVSAADDLFVYDWDYTDTTAGADAVANTLTNSVVTADVITHAVAKQFSNGSSD